MPKFQVVMPHDPSQCVEALEEVLNHDPDFHDQIVYGCRVGDCTGYALIEASNEEEIRSRIPKTLSKRARVVGVEHVAPRETRSSNDRAT